MDGVADAVQRGEDRTRPDSAETKHPLASNTDAEPTLKPHWQGATGLRPPQEVKHMPHLPTTERSLLDERRNVFEAANYFRDHTTPSSGQLVQWLALSPHSKKVVGSIPTRVPPTVQRHAR